jgi:hypothetical protein
MYRECIQKMIDDATFLKSSKVTKVASGIKFTAGVMTGCPSVMGTMNKARLDLDVARTMDARIPGQSSSHLCTARRPSVGCVRPNRCIAEYIKAICHLHIYKLCFHSATHQRVVVIYRKLDRTCMKLSL